MLHLHLCTFPGILRHLQASSGILRHLEHPKDSLVKRIPWRTRILVLRLNVASVWSVLSLAASLWICPDIPDAFCAYTFLSAIARAPSTKGTATTKRINLKFLKEFASNAAQEFRRVAATPPKDRNEETYFSKEKLENKNLSLNAHKRLSPGTRTRLLSRVLTEYFGKRRKPAFDSSNSNSYSNFTRTASVFSQCIPCVLASLLPQHKGGCEDKKQLVSTHLHDQSTNWAANCRCVRLTAAGFVESLREFTGWHTVGILFGHTLWAYCL